ncbi:MAG: hypothetical protein R2834_04615 [Rhodothermales bacterium]
MLQDLLTHWQTLGQISPRYLIGARLQLHWAAQVPASLGFTYVPPEPDFSHTSLFSRVDTGVARLVSQPVLGGIRASIRVADLTLELIDATDAFVDRLHLHGRTLDEAYEWLTGALYARTGVAHALVRPDHTLPDHPVASGAPFLYGESLEFDALERWFVDAHALLHHLRDAHDPGAAVRCWPHHLDMAFLIALDPDAAPEEARSVGVGMSPGDAAYTQPYFYVNHWPRHAGDALPPLPVGQWHRNGWLGAALTGERLIEARSTAAQVDTALRFFDAAIEASMRLLPED